MQIRNDYTPYSHQTYEHAHTHNITECFHEEQSEKHAGMTGNRQVDAVSYQQQRQDTLELFSMTAQESARTDNRKKGLSLIKGFWNSLGEEGTGSNIRQIPLSVKEAIVSHMQGMIHSAQTALQGMMQHKFIRRIAKLPTVIKTEVSGALKRFKGNEAFAALTDGRMPSKQNANTGKGNQKGQVTTEKKEEELRVKEQINSHLMDSYSKKGTYCKINENLTYQKNINTKQVRRQEIQETNNE